jgi:hypothetical protein
MKQDSLSVTSRIWSKSDNRYWRNSVQRVFVTGFDCLCWLFSVIPWLWLENTRANNFSGARNCLTSLDSVIFHRKVQRTEIYEIYHYGILGWISKQVSFVYMQDNKTKYRNFTCNKNPKNTVLYELGIEDYTFSDEILVPFS